MIGYVGLHSAFIVVLMFTVSDYCSNVIVQSRMGQGISLDVVYGVCVVALLAFRQLYVLFMRLLHCTISYKEFGSVLNADLSYEYVAFVLAAVVHYCLTCVCL